jgi:3-hydroxyacyl-[acyl-carrier-protein] dehydratase
MTTETSKRPIVFNAKEVAGILPHRYPFLLVDRVIDLDLEENRIVAQKNVTMNEQFFQGHFPFAPIMPGVLILEALAQTGGILVHRKGYDRKLAVLLNMNNVKFRRPVVPGDVLILHATALHLSNRAGKFTTKALVDDRVVAEAEIAFALVDKENI